MLDLEVRLSIPDTGEFQGRCLDLAPIENGMLASVEFDAAHAPLLGLGARTELEFRPKDLDFPVHTEALAVVRSDDAAHRRYCFRGNITKRVFLHLLSRRRSIRIRLPPSKALRVSVLDMGNAPLEAILHDVSAMGLSILLGTEFEQQLYERTLLRLAVQLPGEEQAIEIVAAIRHRRLLGSAVLYGLEIDGQVPEIMRAQDKFSLYVASLQELGSRRS